MIYPIISAADSQGAAPYSGSGTGCCMLRLLYPVAGETLNRLSIVLGQAAPCSQIVLCLDGKLIIRTCADACGHWEAFPLEDLDAGPHSLQAVSDCCGADRVSFIIGVSAPVPQPVITYPGELAGEASPLFQGSARPGDSVRICVDGAVCSTVMTDQDGSFRWPYPEVLDEGIHIVTAIAIGPDGRESGAAYQIFRYQAGQGFSVTLENAHAGSGFRTVDLELTVTGASYPATLYYLLLPPGSAAPSAEEIMNYTGPGLADGTAAAGSVQIHSGGARTVTVSGLDHAPEGAVGLMDGYRYDVYLVVADGTNQSPVLSAGNILAMPFAGGAGTEAAPYRIRELTLEEISQKYPDLSAAQSPLGVDDTAHMLLNIDRMHTVFQETGGARGVRNSMGADYLLTTPFNLAGYAAANGGQGWPVLGFLENDLEPTPFYGSLTGLSGETPIRNLTIIRNSVHSHEGLFAYSTNALFKNITLENATIIVSNYMDEYYGPVNIAVLSAGMKGGVLDGIAIRRARLIGNGDGYSAMGVGAIAAKVTEGLWAGNLTGEQLHIDVTNSYEPVPVGGLFGRIDHSSRGVTIENATVLTSTIAGLEDIGGLAGRIIGFRTLRGITVQDSSLSGGYAVGGLAAHLREEKGIYSGTVEDAHSINNTITAEYSYAGGLLAYSVANHLILRDSGASGCTIQCGEGDYGGILGYIESLGPIEISRCLAESCRLLGTDGNFSVAGFAGTMEFWQDDDSRKETSLPAINDCTVRDTRIDIQGGGFRIGGFAGYLLGSYGCRFNRCHVIDGGIRSKADQVGGFAGDINFNDAAPEFTDCSALMYDGLTCSDSGGGFVGYCDISVFTRCRAAASVSGRMSLGGFVGDAYSSIYPEGLMLRFIQCAAIGAVRQTLGEGHTGGFAGRLEEAYLSQCFASGTLDTDSDYSGALVGRAIRTVLIEDCYTSGDLTSSGRNTGGLIGYADAYSGHHPTVSRCYSQGSIQGGSRTGGLCGWGDVSTTIGNSLVLSPSISGAAPTNRVAGEVDSNVILRGNYAATTQVLQDGVQKPIMDDPDGLDGGTITAGQITSFMTDAGWQDTVWDYASVAGGSGPKLLNTPED